MVRRKKTKNLLPGNVKILEKKIILFERNKGTHFRIYES